MNPQSVSLRVLRLTALLCIALLAASCGGGGSIFVIVPPLGLVPNFMPDQSSPVLPSISMQAGMVNDSAFDVEIEVTDIDDFFGAAFQVTFLPGSVTFLGFDTTGSILTGMDPTFEVTTLALGQIAVLATLPEGTPAGLINGDGLLLTLSFDATALVTGNTFDFPVASRLVEACPNGQACNEIQGAVNWEEGSLDVD